MENANGLKINNLHMMRAKAVAIYKYYWYLYDLLEVNEKENMKHAYIELYEIISKTKGHKTYAVLQKENFDILLFIGDEDDIGICIALENSLSLETIISYKSKFAVVKETIRQKEFLEMLVEQVKKESKRDVALGEDDAILASESTIKNVFGSLCYRKVLDSAVETKQFLRFEKDNENLIEYLRKTYQLIVDSCDVLKMVESTLDVVPCEAYSKEYSKKYAEAVVPMKENKSELYRFTKLSVEETVQSSGSRRFEKLRKQLARKKENLPMKENQSELDRFRRKLYHLFEETMKFSRFGGFAKSLEALGRKKENVPMTENKSEIDRVTKLSVEETVQLSGSEGDIFFIEDIKTETIAGVLFALEQPKVYIEKNAKAKKRVIQNLVPSAKLSDLAVETAQFSREKDQASFTLFQQYIDVPTVDLYGGEILIAEESSRFITGNDLIQLLSTPTNYADNKLFPVNMRNIIISANGYIGNERNVIDSLLEDKIAQRPRLFSVHSSKLFAKIGTGLIEYGHIYHISSLNNKLRKQQNADLQKHSSENPKDPYAYSFNVLNNSDNTETSDKEVNDSCLVFGNNKQHGTEHSNARKERDIDTKTPKDSNHQHLKQSVVSVKLGLGKHKNRSRYPTRYTRLLKDSPEFRAYFEDAITELTSSGLIFARHGKEPPHVLWPSGHPLLPYKVRVVENSNVDNQYLDRLHTFLLKKNQRKRNWPDENIVRPEPLVNAGFSYEGNDDEVVCKKCGLRSKTSEWSDDDDDYAMNKHSNAQQNCPFVLQTVKRSGRQMDNSTAETANESTRRGQHFQNSDETISNGDSVINVVMYLNNREMHGCLQNPYTSLSRRYRSKNTADGNIVYSKNVNSRNDIYASLNINKMYFANIYCKIGIASRLTNQINNNIELMHDSIVNENITKVQLGLPITPFSEGNTFIPEEYLYTENEHFCRVPSMKYEKHRIYSYLIMGKYDSQSSLIMARYGFFHTGTKDTHMCFCCGVIVADISDVDIQIIYNMHGIDRNVCRFIQRQKPPFQNKKLYRFPEYRDPTNREASFINTYTFYENETVDALVDAGFFHAPLGSLDDESIYSVVTCFCCGIAIIFPRRQTDIWKYHAMYSPFCEYLIDAKGKNFIKSILRRVDDQCQVHERHLDTTSGNQIRDKRSMENYKEEDLCVFCSHAPREVMYLSCGHYRTCIDCKERTDHCDYCDARIERRIVSTPL